MKRVHIEIRCEDCGPDFDVKEDVDNCLCILWDDKKGLMIIPHGTITDKAFESAVRQARRDFQQAKLDKNKN